MTKLIINGVQREIDASPDTPLLWVIRDELKLTGTKFGCGSGLCGACTIHINGQATKSCITPLAAAAGAEITTIEGIKSDAETQHPVQVAWQKESVPQCGYCQSGQIMSATALLADKPNPTDQDINSAMSGNICRCGTYPRIRRAIHLAADLMAVDATKQV